MPLSQFYLLDVTWRHTPDKSFYFLVFLAAHFEFGPRYQPSLLGSPPRHRSSSVCTEPLTNADGPGVCSSLLPVYLAVYLLPTPSTFPLPWRRLSHAVMQASLFACLISFSMPRRNRSHYFYLLLSALSRTGGPIPPLGH